MNRARVIGGVRRHLSGWRPARPDRRMASARAPAVTMSEFSQLPDVVDLEPRMPPVNDQGQLGTCLANSMCEAIEYLEDGQPWRPLSRLFVYAIGREEDGVPLSDDSGLDMHSTWGAVQRLGTCWESTWPYDPAMYSIDPPEGARAEANEHRPQFGYFCPDLFTVMARLAAGFPVAYGQSLPANFESAECLSTGVCQIPAPGEGFIGGHSMLAIGYDKRGSDPNAWPIKVRNSWGPDVGQRGNFFMPGYYWLTGAPLAPLAGDNLAILKVPL